MSLLEDFDHYALRLSRKYVFSGSGADEQDVYQVAMISAWKMLVADPNVEPRFIMRDMRLRVLDFVRLRKGQPRFEREMIPLLLDIPGNDSTAEKVIIRDELQRLVTAVRKLPKHQRVCMYGWPFGWG